MRGNSLVGGWYSFVFYMKLVDGVPLFAGAESRTKHHIVISIKGIKPPEKIENTDVTNLQSCGRRVGRMLAADY